MHDPVGGMEIFCDYENGTLKKRKIILYYQLLLCAECYMRNRKDVKSGLKKGKSRLREKFSGGGLNFLM